MFKLGLASSLGLGLVVTCFNSTIYCMHQNFVACHTKAVLFQFDNHGPSADSYSDNFTRETGPMAAEAIIMAIAAYLIGGASAAGGFFYAFRAYKNYRDMCEEKKLCAVCGKQVKVMLSEEHIEQHRIDEAQRRKNGYIHVSHGVGSAADVGLLE